MNDISFYMNDISYYMVDLDVLAHYESTCLSSGLSVRTEFNYGSDSFHLLAIF